MTQIIKSWHILLAIVFLGLFLRTFNLSSNPPEFFEDEITNLISARSVLLEGKDINDELNLYFYNRVESRSPVYGYLSALSSFIFGLNTFAARLPAALMGTFSIVIIYLITMELTNKNRQASLLASFVMAIIPWQIHYSRVGWEPAATIPLLLISILLFLKGLANKNYIIFSYLLFSLTLFTHRSAEFLSPVFLTTLIIINFNSAWRHLKYHLVGILFIATTAVVIVSSSQTDPLIHERSKRIFTFSSGITQSSLTQFKKNYIVHLSPEFLFQRGDPNLRHGTGINGVLYSGLIMFLLGGIVYCLWKFKSKGSLFILFWLIVYPLGGSLTNDGAPHATRTLIGSPLAAILSGFGFIALKNLINKSTYPKKAVITLFFTSISILLVQLFMFSKNYFGNYPSYSSLYWNYGNKNIFDFVNTLGNDSKTICLENLNYWNEEVLKRFYLKDVESRIISGIEEQECNNAGSINLIGNFEVRENCQPFHYVYDLNNYPIYQFCVIE